jgi:uncharacterized membrane protein YbhN (UPF0104 family)
MTGRRILRITLQLALIGFVGWYLRVHWADYRNVFAQATPDWSALVLSSFFVLVAYVVLIQTWRQVVVAWGERLDFASAMRIWFVSNLGKYVPGKVWSIAAMGSLAQEQGISPVAAVGSSIVVQLVNVVTGFGVFFLAGARAMSIPAGAVVGAILLGAGLFGSPWLVPVAVRAINRFTRRQIDLPFLPHRAIWWAAAGTTLAWLFYGLAFELFAWGVSGNNVHGTMANWTAVFIGSYLLGFIAVFAPGGAGVREVAMAEALQRSGLAVGAMAALLVAASRIWLTVLEVVPGVLFLLVRPLDRPASSSRK